MFLYFFGPWLSLRRSYVAFHTVNGTLVLSLRRRAKQTKRPGGQAENQKTSHHVMTSPLTLALSDYIVQYFKKNRKV